MDMIEQAINLTSKYGISLNKFGPYVSFIDEKIGICLDLKDDKFDYLKRNFSFNNLEDFEMFLKKYCYYKNNLKGNTSITLDDYEKPSPNIIYGFDQKEKAIEKNKEVELKYIKDSLKDLYGYLENVYTNRTKEMLQRKEAYEQMELKLYKYKKSLHTFYNKEYEEESKPCDNVLEDNEKKYLSNLDSSRKEIESLQLTDNLDDIKARLKKFIDVLKNYELDREYFDNVFEISLFKNKCDLLDEMNNCVLSSLDSEIKISPKELKEKLELIKSSNEFKDDKEKFIDDNFALINEKYLGLTNVSEYNFANYLNNKELQELNLELLEENDKKDYIIENYQDLKAMDKKLLLLLFSPLKEIIIDLMNNNNLEENTPYYESIYNELVDSFNNSDNLIYKKKYFSLINFNTYKEFMACLLEISKKINDITIKTSRDTLVWAYKTDNNLIQGSLETVKSVNEEIDSYLIKKDVDIIYSKYKISLINDLYELQPNRHVYIKKDDVTIILENKNDNIKIFNPYLEEMEIKNKDYYIATKFYEVGVCKYNNYVVKAKTYEED